MGLFEKKNKTGTVIASAPEEPETDAEIQHIEDLNDSKVENTPVNDAVSTSPSLEEKVEIREIPVCMSEAQIYNLIIENNIMLKQILAEMK